MAAISEAMTISARLGIDDETFLDVLRHGSAGGYMLERKVPMLLEPSTPPAFPIRLGHKDLRLALDLCEQQGLPSFVAGQVEQLFRLAERRGLEDHDVAHLATLLRELADPPAATEGLL